MAFFTSNTSSFLVEIHSSFDAVVEVVEEEVEKEEMKIFSEIGLEGEELYKAMFVSAIVIMVLVLIFVLCSRCYSRMKKESAELKETKNNDVNMVARLDTIK